MKRTFANSTLLAVALLASAAVSRAESLRAHIPFAFLANGKALPAGDYTIREMPGAPTVLLIEGGSAADSVMTFARTSADTLTSKAAPLTFLTSSSNQMELVGIKAAGRTYELSSGMSSRGSAKSTVLAITPVTAVTK